MEGQVWRQYVIAGVGPFIAGYLASKIGRKWSVISGGVPLLVGWILVAVARHVGLIYAGRVLWGVSAGMMFTATPMYCAEIATTDSRGALGSFLQIFITMGIFIVYAVGPFVSYTLVACFGVVIATIFVFFVSFMPESPIYYLINNDKESATKCLMTLRGRSRAGVEIELAQLEADAQASMTKGGKISDIFRGSNFKAFYISCGLIFFQQLCGINAVLFYMNTIFSAAGSDLDPAIATIIIGAVQASASLTTTFVVDRLGRKILLLISTTGTSISLVFLGMFFILNEYQAPVVKHLGFLPILSLVLFILTFSWGLGPLPWAIMSEIFPIEVKATASPIATAFSWILSFLVTRYFGPLASAVGMYTAFWIFGVCCAVGFFFTLLLVPETKGKSFAQIQELLADKTHHENETNMKDIEVEGL